MQCIEYFQLLAADGKSWELASETREELDKIESGRGSASLYAKRTIIVNNLYGVDIDDGAVEICKLRLWLSMLADIENEPSEVETLPNIDFNVRQGNSLIGFTDIVEYARGGGEEVSLSTWGGGVGPAVRELYADVIEAVERHQQATSTSEASEARRLAESRIESHSETLNEKILDQFHAAGIEAVDLDELEEYAPFHWILEFASVYRDGGFDIVIGNPPWEVLSPNRDDYFSKYDEQFRTYDADWKDEVQSELLEDLELREGWQGYQESMERRADYFNESNEYELQSPSVGGRAVASENDLSALFLERIFDLTTDGSQVSLILPGFVLTGAVAKDLRRHLLDETNLRTMVGFENKGIFDEIHNQYRFGIFVFEAGGQTDHVHGLFEQTSLDALDTVDTDAVDISRTVLGRYSPEAGVFPLVDSQREATVMERILDNPPVGDSSQTWYGDLVTKELHEPTDKGRFVESESAGDYPVYGGANIHQFVHDNEIVRDLDDPRYYSVESADPDQSARARVRQKAFNKGRLKKAIYTEFGGDETSKSQKQFVNDLLRERRGRELHEGDILPDHTEYRIGYRDVARSTDERTLVASVVPPGTVCLHTLQTMRPYRVNVVDACLDRSPLHDAYERIFTDRELFVTVGLLNSIPFDFLMRTKIDTHIVKYKLEESQLPRLTDGDDWFHYIADRAARLNCYGEAFAEMRDRLGGIEPATEKTTRREVQAELDAAAFHAYDLDEAEMQFVLDDFHRVSNPRIMTEEYFETVAEKYTHLSDVGPME